MDKFGIFYDLERLAAFTPEEDLLLERQQFWLKKLDAMGSNSYLICCWSVRKNMPECHVIRAKGLRNVKTWVFESFEAGYHNSESFGELLGKMVKISIYRLRLSKFVPDMSLHLSKIWARDKLLYSALISSGGKKSYVEHRFNLKQEQPSTFKLKYSTLAPLEFVHQLGTVMCLELVSVNAAA
jgi:hypothetical protein